MSEIEKLYENANIKPYTTCGTGFVAHYKGRSYACDVKECDKCKSVRKVYPPFTEKKQLELIKWLGELDLLEIIRTTRDTKEWIINSEYGMSGNVYKHASRAKTFEEALAKLINSLWQSITDVEKEQIRDILKG